MKKIITFIFFSLSVGGQLYGQYYNHMPVPDTLAGYIDTINHTGAKTYNLLMQEGIKYFYDTSHATITSGFSQFSFNTDSPYNYIDKGHNTFLGPTLIMNYGDHVQMNVVNLLNDSSSVHWHGIHLPPMMDGGPHQVIPHGTIWQPYWTVSDSAATYWYHPHLHHMTETQVTKGLAGLIIVRSPSESALPLPRTYGTDDIPVIITDRRFDTNKQFIIAPRRSLGDTVLTNGVIHAEYTVPAQVVRLRILNASISRLYKLGFRKPDSANFTFSVIGSDGGLLNAPVSTDTFLTAPGQRVELLLNLAAYPHGSSIDLVAYNNTLDSLQSGGPFPGNDSLSGREFNILHLVVGPPTTSPILTIPSALIKNSYLDTSGVSGNNYKTKIFKFGQPVNDTPKFGFVINQREFDMGTDSGGRMGTINDSIPENATQIWTIKDAWNWDTSDIAYNSGVSHVFHIHDIQFHILRRNDSAGNMIPLSVSDSGWKDDVNFDVRSSVTFVGEFKDFTDNKWPFMYHCHMLDHEDGGMMGQFLVMGNIAGITNTLINTEPGVKVFPNPASDKIYFEMEDKTSYAYYATIFDNVGRTRYMLPKPDAINGINISALRPGDYFITIKDSNGYSTTKKFIKL